MIGHAGGVAAAALGITMLGAFACLIGGIMLVAKGRDTRRGMLLLVMAGVLVGNVLIWSL